MGGISLFSISEYGELILNKPAILKHYVYRSIIRRDRGSTGDHEGRRKDFAYKEFAYIYYMADYDSLPNRNGYKLSDKYNYARKAAGLPYSWKPDDTITSAIRVYKEEQTSIQRDIIQKLLCVLHNDYDIIELVDNKIKELIAKPLLENVDIDDLLGYQEKLVNLSVVIPRRIKDLSIVLEDIEKTEVISIHGKVRGTDDVIPDSADPERTY